MISMDEMKADLAATQRDFKRLSTICSNLEDFMRDSGGEDRRAFRVDLLKFEGLQAQAERLIFTITARMKEQICEEGGQRSDEIEDTMRSAG